MSITELSRYRLTGFSSGTAYFVAGTTVSNAMSVTTTAVTTDGDSLKTFEAIPITSGYVTETIDD